MLGSSVRRVPAAALRGLTAGGRPSLLALFVEALEGCLGHDDFAAHFKCLRQTLLFQAVGGDGERHAADGADVGGDVFAGLAVAAGDAA